VLARPGSAPQAVLAAAGFGRQVVLARTRLLASFGAVRAVLPHHARPGLVGPAGKFCLPHGAVSPIA
jgi:hypothetical protein